MRNYRLLLSVLLVTTLLFSCKKEDVKPDPQPQPEPVSENIKINQFIKTVMTDIYLWSDKVDTSIPITKDTDPQQYFNQLVYSKKDKWSWITDDVVALRNSFAGKEKSFGYSLAFGQFTGTENYFGIVQYVYPNTPAAQAGLKRGSLIVKLDGKDITQNNFRNLLFGDNITITLGKITEKGIAPDGEKTIFAKELDLDPVLITKVIEKDGKKIGYLFYAQYIHQYNSSLDKALEDFKTAGVTDVVLDLRYNRGGAVTAAKHLCSLLAPENIVNNKDILITYRWNAKYQKIFEDQNSVGNLEEHFDANVPVKLNLNKLYVLTGRNTASASELTITALKPYMNEVITIGSTTHGKYCASITMTPKQYYKDETYYESFKNWALQPIVAKYANATGVTDFENGFAPTWGVKDELLPAIELGNIQEPLLKKAVELITGNAVTASTKSASIAVPDYKIIDSGFSRFDKQKTTLDLGTVEVPVK